MNNEQIWYFSGEAKLLKIGDAIQREDDPHAFCLYAATTVEDAIRAAGFQTAVYAVAGEPCKHPWPREYSYDVAVPNSGYCPGHADLTYKWGESGPFSWHYPKETVQQFDSLKVVKVLQSEAFGANGKQVFHALKWFRSKFELRDSRVWPLLAMESAFDKMWAYYDDRLSSNGFWWNELGGNDKQSSDYVSGKSAAKASTKIWLGPNKFVNALNDCHLAAARARRATICEWLEGGSFGLAALCLRDQIAPGTFNEMWRGMEDIMPIAQLDGEVRPVLHSEL